MSTSAADNVKKTQHYLLIHILSDEDKLIIERHNPLAPSLRLSDFLEEYEDEDKLIIERHNPLAPSLRLSDFLEEYEIPLLHNPYLSL